MIDTNTSVGTPGTTSLHWAIFLVYPNYNDVDNPTGAHVENEITYPWAKIQIQGIGTFYLVPLFCEYASMATDLSVLSFDIGPGQNGQLHQQIWLGALNWMEGVMVPDILFPIPIPANPPTTFSVMLNPRTCGKLVSLWRLVSNTFLTMYLWKDGFVTSLVIRTTTTMETGT